MSLRVIFAGGGTGGHVFPAVAMAQALRRRGDVEVTFVGARGGLEERILGGDERVVLLPGSGVRGAGAWGRLRALARLAVAVLSGVRRIRRERPDVVVGTGGYASAAMAVAAVITRTPLVLQEQNSVPGLVNRRLARFADRVLVAFDAACEALGRTARVEVVGNPLRPARELSREAAAREIGVDPARPVVVVVGGSRGARRLNDAAAGAAECLRRCCNAQTVIVTGRDDAERVRARVANVEGVRVLPWCDAMDAVFAAADVAVARAGASVVFELARAGVPTVFVPYPHAADDHQRRNAEPFAAAGGARVVADDELTPETLVEVVCELVEHPAERRAMAEAMRAAARPDAADRAAEAILDVVKKNGAARAARRRELVRRVA